MKVLLSAFCSSLLVILFIVSADAQSQSVRNGFLNHTGNVNIQTGYFMPGIQSILQNQYARREENRKYAAKTTNISGERLKAFCGYNLHDTSYLPYGRSDSGYYFYSGSRSSVFNYQMMNYQSPCFATYTSPVGDNYPLNLLMEPGNYSPMRLQLFSDSVYVWNSFNPLGAPYGFADVAGDLYNDTRLIHSSNKYYPAIPGLMDRTDYYYDSLGNFTEAVSFKYDTITHAWDTSRTEILVYNSFNQLTVDSVAIRSGSGIWSESSKSVCTYGTYSTPNNIIYYADSSGYWQPQTMRYLYYNSDSTLHSDSMCQYNLGLWIPYAKDSFGYTSGISYFTYGQTETYESGSVWDKCTYTKNVNLTGLPDTLYYRYYGGDYGPVSTQMAGKKVYFVYDTAKNPTQSQSFNYSLTDTLAGTGSYASSAERIFYYYYEYYNVTEVQPISMKEEAILFYPNPTANELTIARPDAITGTSTLIKITNQVGQTITEINLPWINKSETISLSSLVPGIYFVSVLDNGGKLIATQKIIKR